MKPVLVCLVSLVMGSMGWAKTATTATEIIRKGESVLRGHSTQMLTTMKVYRQNYTRTLSLRTWSLGQNRSLIEILEPVKEKGIASLRIDAQMWNYLPKSDQIVKVPSSMLMQSWMGSDFTNDDILKMTLLETDYTHRFSNSHAVGSARVIECLPKPSAPVVWGKILYWARRSDGLPERQEFFDDRHRHVRSLLFSDFKRMDDRLVPAKIRVFQTDNPQEFTEIIHEKILFDRDIGEILFDRNNLKRASQNGMNLQAGWVLSLLHAMP